MPQANGQVSALGLAALAAKRVPLACAQRRAASSEQDVPDGSDGYRPGRGALEAVRDLPCDRQYGTYGYGGEVDVKGFFDHLNTAPSPPEAPRRLPAAHGMEQTAPAPAGAGMLPAAAPPVTGPR
jgi:hypothetical protein